MKKKVCVGGKVKNFSLFEFFFFFCRERERERQKEKKENKKIYVKKKGRAFWRHYVGFPSTLYYTKHNTIAYLPLLFNSMNYFELAHA